MALKRIAVFCGSKQGVNELYREAAISLGQELTRNDLGLVFGGGKIGLMGVIADEVLRGNGEAIGVIPKKLMDIEVGHQGLTDLIVVDDMHRRKAKMNDLADGFICLAGGIGTLEELFEVYTWAHIGYHQKPIALINTNGFYEPLVTMLEHVVQEGFLEKEFKEQLIVADTPKEVIKHLL